MAYNLNQHKPHPDIKIGLRLNDEYANTLLPRIKELLRHKHQGFPGSRPVEFESKHIELLEKEDYFVRDKTYGKRYILFFTAVDGGTAFMMDELCKFRILTGFKLPLRSNHSYIHNETMMDGEVVMDTANKQCLRYLIFDLMVLNGSILIERPYSKRMGMLSHDVLEPLNAVLEKNVEMKKKLPFTMEIKSMQLSYGLINVLNGNDELIFIPVNHPYEPEACKKLLLWKPITQLTVDFMIEVLYIKEEKKSIYHLLKFDDRNHTFCDQLTPESNIAIQWQDNPPDRKIATFWYDKSWKTIIHHEGVPPYSRDGGWRFLRFVHEKHIADHERIVEHVYKRIQNAVSRDTLEKRISIIRENWKRRQSIQLGAQPLTSPTPQVQTQSINNVLSKNRLDSLKLYNESENRFEFEKRLVDIQDSSKNIGKGLVEISELTIKSDLSPKTSPILVHSKDLEVIRRSDVINFETKKLKQSDEELSNDESDIKSNDKENESEQVLSDDDVEKTSSDNDLSSKRMSTSKNFSTITADGETIESNGVMSEQNYIHQEESSTEDANPWGQPESHENPMLDNYQEYSVDDSTINKDDDGEREHERFITSNLNNSNLLRPIPRRHTLSGINNPSYQQNIPNPYTRQRQMSVTVFSYPPPRPESSISSASHPIHDLPLQSPISTIPQRSSQIPEAYGNTRFIHNAPLQSFNQQHRSLVIQQIPQQTPVLRPTPQKHKLNLELVKDLLQLTFL
ncbi:9089_t:CDS:10 [Funneliformis geosporum]|uniref:9089_t:CDS:1 n=1 Tax=Funneliformis geosporum TaxID=1117311 RepID=A0A9W4SGX0_9GLOM|nr:9089_t:CDS:10 [Funneliformis geosporum]